MSKRVRRLFALLACGLVVTGCKSRMAARAEFPNAPVILISIGTLRTDHLSIYGGHRVSTPAIDRLANDGIVYENAYAQLPSHATMMTGQLPAENDVRSSSGNRLATDRGLTLPRLLKERGYATGGAVSAQVIPGNTGLGPLFDFYEESEGASNAATSAGLQGRGTTAHVALSWLDNVEERPFFLFLHLFGPHTPYEPVEPFRTRYASSPYDGEIATVDAIVGHFLGELDARGLYDKSMIILAGDHGETEAGGVPNPAALHVPLIVKLPHHAMRGKRVGAPAQLADILPTITSAVGARTPPRLPGVSLLDLARGVRRTR